MISRRVILTIVFLSIVLLLIECFLSFDFAVSKNDELTHIQKDQIEKMANIDSVKTEAKESLDVIRKVHRDNSNVARWRFFLLISTLIGTILLIFNKKRNATN